MNNDAKDGGKRLLTKKQLAVALSLSPRTIENLMTRGSLPHIKLRRAVRFDLDDVLQTLKSTNQVNAVLGREVPRG
jgi:excisionase family DNA binding protein